MLPTAVRKLSCNPALRKTAQRFHISSLVRRVYCRLLSSNGILQVSCLGATAFFKTSNSKQLSFVDYIATSESDVIEAALCSLRPGGVFLDVGCHYGIFSIIASKLVGPAGRVLAVEPHPEPLRVLRENVSLNHCSNINILDFAFSDKTGALPLVFNEYTVGQQSGSGSASVQPVMGMVGDEAIQVLPPPNAVKIDVEGHEYSVLLGLRKTLSSPLCQRLCLEIHPLLLPNPITAADVVAFVRECGFTIASCNQRSDEILLIGTKDSISGAEA